MTLNCSSTISLLEGDSFACLCKGEGGNPTANVTWYKDGVKFTDVGTERQILNLPHVGSADRGTYKCVATSYANENYTDEKSIQVNVYCKLVCFLYPELQQTTYIINFAPLSWTLGGGRRMNLYEMASAWEQMGKK